ncbi:tetratricopeptide repeat protein [Maribacter sp. CXY002]|uniref:tetratricopeptide repeat protein n=1 Tax=Maribacter luteocoastalis TaxID=3407671 RepID=UPI003B66F5A0
MFSLYLYKLNDDQAFSYLPIKKKIELNTMVNEFDILDYFEFSSSDQVKQIMALGGKPDLKKIIIPTHLKDSLSQLKNSNSRLFELFHAIGHLINNHIENDSLNSIKMELSSDNYTGYNLNRLGFNLAFCKTTLRNIELDANKSRPELYKQREQAFVMGWERFNKEQELYIKKDSLPIYTFDLKKIDSLKAIAHTELSNNPLKSASAFSKAYQHSQGKYIKYLYSAFQQYALSTNHHPEIILIGNQLLKNGLGFLDNDSYLAFFKTLIEAYYKNGEFNESLRIIEFALTIDPLNLDIIMFRDKIYQIQLALDKRIITLKEAIKIKPSSAYLYFELGNVFAQKKESIESAKYYKRALVLEPEYTIVRIQLSEVYINEAYKLTKVVQKEINSNTSHFNVNSSIEIIKQLWTKAEEVLTKGLKSPTKNKNLKAELKKLRKIKKSQALIYPIGKYYIF